MKSKLKLSKIQWKVLSSAFSNISQAVILFSAAAFFVPEAISLPRDFSRTQASLFLLSGLIMMTISVTVSKRGK